MSEVLHIYLSQKESKVLQVLKVPSTLAQITRLAKLPRSTTEYTLWKLLEKNQIQTERFGKRLKYFSVQKNNTERLTIPSSTILSIGPITLYTGVQALETLWREVVSLPKETRLIGIQPRRSFSEILKKVNKKEIRDISQMITDKKFIVDAIVHEDLAKSLFRKFAKNEAWDVAKAFVDRPEAMVKVDNNFLDEEAEFFILPEYLVLINWHTEIAVKISDTNIINLMKSVYEAVKAYGVKYNQGEYIKKLKESA